jgi:hypothetical protein
VLELFLILAHPQAEFNQLVMLQEEMPLAFPLVVAQVHQLRLEPKPLLLVVVDLFAVAAVQ